MKKEHLRLLERIKNATRLYEEACIALWINPADEEAADKAKSWDWELFLLREKLYVWQTGRQSTRTLG